MGWQFTLLFIFGSMIILMFVGMPVAFAFLTINVISVFLFWGGLEHFPQLIGSMFSSSLPVRRASSICFR